jgi:hypothetical protein
VRALRCDRCRGYEDGEPAVVVTIKPALSPKGRTVELCCQCQMLLSEWVDTYANEADRA